MAGRGPQGDLSAARGEAMDRSRHTPVLLTPVLEHLQPTNGATYIDATLGAGGYTRAILNAADCRVLAVDRDPTPAGELARSRARLPPTGHGLARGVELLDAVISRNGHV